METKILNSRIFITPDEQTGTKKPGFTAVCSTLGVADDGDTIDEAIKNIRGAIEAYVDSLITDGMPVPVDQPEQEVITNTQISISRDFKFA